MTVTTASLAPTFRLDASSDSLPAVGTYPNGYAITAERDGRHRFANDFNQVKVRITGRGHWYRTDDVNDGLHNDIICRGCGHHGHFPYILDYEACSSPATAVDAVAALAGAARAFQAGDQVRGYRVALGGHFTATVTRLYQEDGIEVADAVLRDGTTATRLDPKHLHRAS